jgi:hypothetical protein
MSYGEHGRRMEVRMAEEDWILDFGFWILDGKSRVGRGRLAAPTCRQRREVWKKSLRRKMVFRAWRGGPALPGEWRCYLGEKSLCPLGKIAAWDAFDHRAQGI